MNRLRRYMEYSGDSREINLTGFILDEKEGV